MDKTGESPNQFLGLGIFYFLGKLSLDKIKKQMKKLSLGIKFIVYTLIFLYIGTSVGYAGQNFPQRIISLGPSITEQLYLLSAQDRLVGCTIYCKRPKEAKSKEKVGTVVEVNLEKIIGLKPDLVLATSLTNFKAIKKLKDLGIEVVSFFPPKNFDEICEQFLELGEIIGKEKKAEKIISKAKD
ncbi:MAG: ABC transporter substrate-binding protein, partial [Candidatus Omnitrophica bacterium]|nr:ABC transporter substrate-binding protein [Candidatus Omnitrophota bacterium]